MLGIKSVTESSKVLVEGEGQLRKSTGQRGLTQSWQKGPAVHTVFASDTPAAGQTLSSLNAPQPQRSPHLLWMQSLNN